MAKSKRYVLDLDISKSQSHRTNNEIVLYGMTQKYFSFTVLVLGGLAFRLILILYGEYHDKHSPLKYTDVDYRVFSDAASFILHPTETNHAQGYVGGKLDLGESVEPYLRHPPPVSHTDGHHQSIHTRHISLYTLISAHAYTKRIHTFGIWQEPLLSGRRADSGGPP